MLDVLWGPEDQAVRQEARELACSVEPSLLTDMDADRVRYPREFVEEAARRKLLGLRFTAEVGGRGLGWTAEVAAIEEIGTLGCALACLYSLPSIVGQSIATFGTDEQKERFLRPTLEARIFCAEALTEPRGGSDFFGASTTARREGDSYVLNGQKRFIVGGEGADYFLVYARTAPPDAPSHKAISAFIVERDDTVKAEHVYGLLGSRGGGTARVRFRETVVLAEALVGGENRGAEVFNVMMVPERLTSAAGAVGLARAALEVASRYADRRHAFGQKIRRFQGVSFQIAEALTALDAARALVYAAARVADSGKDPRRLVSEAKKFATETSWEVVNKSMQVMGGIGYTDVYPVERLLRDARLSMIWTGTSEIMSLLIQHEHFKEMGDDTRFAGRNVEQDAANADQDEEKIYGEPGTEGPGR